MSNKAVIIHCNAKQNSQITQYVLNKYGALCTNKSDIEQIIKLAKISQEYAKRRRAHIVKRFQEEVGIKAVNQYDASHQLTDDDNTHYITAQRAKVGDCVIYNDPIVNKVHIFEGLGNEAWNNAAPGSTLFNYDEIPYDIEMFKRVIAPTAKYLKSLDTL